MPPIQFRCIRCQHPVETPENAVGQKMYCPVCYLELRVPTESTIQDIPTEQLYEADAVPMDVREMKGRLSLASVRCPVCHTYISVDREQAGTDVVCPECDTKVPVPKDIIERIDHAVQTGGGRRPVKSADQAPADTYGVHDAAQVTSKTDWSRHFPVQCKLCGTRMYASEDQVGQELTCPDCGTKTVVPPRVKSIPKPPPLPSSVEGAFEGGTSFGLSGEAPASGEASGTGRLVPVVCKLCHTRMYARESEIGGFKTCPDCGVQTEIQAVPEEQMSEPEPISGAYGINEPREPRIRPSLRTLTDYRYVDGSIDRELYRDEPPPEDRRGDATGKPTRYTNDLSPGELAQRRALKMAGFAESGYTTEPIRRPPLPPYPFRTRLWTCFKSAFLWGRVLVFLLLTGLGFLLGSILPGLFVVVSAPFGILTMILGLGILVNTLQSLFLWTTTGNDLPGPDDWVDYHFLDSTLHAVWLFFVVTLASTPGYLLFLLFPETSDPNEWGELRRYLTYTIPSVWLVFPVLFLSSMESGSYFMLMAQETCLSLFYRTGVWLRFYFLTGLVGTLFGLFVYLALSVTENVLAIFFSSLPPLALALLLYFRLMGRLGWTLEELARQEAEEEEDE